jgi:hypothetical protein
MWADLEQDLAKRQPTEIHAEPLAPSPGLNPEVKENWKIKFPDEMRALLEWTGADLLNARVSGV